MVKDSNGTNNEDINSGLDVLKIEQEISGLDYILSARAGTFGTVLETDAQLLSVNQSSVKIIAERPVFLESLPPS